MAENLQRSSPDELILVRFEAHPAPDSEDFGIAGGAFVNCWIDIDDGESAEEIARELLEASGWEIDRLDECSVVSQASYTDEPAEGDPDLRELVAQAFQDGAACLFHTWPVESSDTEAS